MSSPAEVLRRGVEKSSKLGEALSSMVDHALSREKLELATRVVARCLFAVVTGRRESCQRPLPPSACWN